MGVHSSRGRALLSWHSLNSLVGYFSWQRRKEREATHRALQARYQATLAALPPEELARRKAKEAASVRAQEEYYRQNPLMDQRGQW